MPKYTSFFDYISSFAASSYEYYQQKPDYIFSYQLEGSLKPFYAIKMDVLNTLQPYPARYTLLLDIIQPARGLMNIIRGLFNILFVPLVISLKSFWQLVNLDFANHSHENGVQLTTWFIEGIAYVSRGIFQLITFPLAWLRIPFRGLLTVLFPVKGDIKQESLPHSTITSFPYVLIKHVFSFLDVGATASTRSVNRSFDLRITQMMGEKKYYLNHITSEITSTRPKSKNLPLSTYYQRGFHLRRIIIERIQDSNTPQSELNQLFGQVLHSGYDQFIPLLKNKINPKAQFRNEEGLLDATFVHLAVQQGYIELLTWLLSQGAPVNARTVGRIWSSEGAIQSVEGFGLTPLFWAASSGNLECLKLLMDHGADVNARRWDFLETPLHYAASNGHLNCVIALIDAGANLAPIDSLGYTPLAAARNGSNEPCAEYIILKMQERHMPIPPPDCCSLM
ncbi:MAG: ankyrin repeat domain-containing protein [Legionella sp.]|nr:ankyrin repeat domain-containing protein [Legionella sp.]